MWRITIFAPFLLIGCALNPKANQPIYETTYDCSISETRGTLRLRAGMDNVGWIDELDGVQMQAGLAIYPEGRIKFQQNGFDNQQFDHPILFFEYPTNLKPDGSLGKISGHPLKDIFGGARGSGISIQRPVAINVFLSLNWREVKALDRDGGVFVFLYNRSGRSLKTLHLPRGYFDEIEGALKTMHARVLAKAADKERLCEAQTYEVGHDIIMVD